MRDTLNERASVAGVRPDRLAECRGESCLERGTGIDLSRPTKIVDVGHDQVTRPDGLDIRPVDPCCLVAWRQVHRHLAVEWVDAVQAERCT